MFHRILTPFERKRIQAFLDNGRGNSDKDANIRQLAHLADAHLQTIHDDYQLLLKFVAKYRTKKAR